MLHMIAAEKTCWGLYSRSSKPWISCDQTQIILMAGLHKHGETQSWFEWTAYTLGKKLTYEDRSFYLENGINQP